MSEFEDDAPELTDEFFDKAKQKDDLPEAILEFFDKAAVHDNSVRISKITGKPVQKRGFASMTPERRKEIARAGGAAVPTEKRAFSQNNELAASAGRKGGLVKKKVVEE